MLRQAGFKSGGRCYDTVVDSIVRSILYLMGKGR